jgi:hypothetical protein
MEVRTQGKDGPKVASVKGCVEEIVNKLDAAQQEWVKKLRNEPQQFAAIEKTIHETLQRLADQITASVLAEATAESPALEAAKKN